MGMAWGASRVTICPFGRIIEVVRKTLIVFLVTVGAVGCALAADDFGPPTGARLPAFSLPDQNGRMHSSRSLLGPKGAAILFYESAAGCPACTAQLEELERHQEAFHQLGLGVAAMSSDNAAVLKDFASRIALHFPLLSDPNSKTVSVLHARPGWLVLDGKGLTVAKYFEQDPSEHYTSAAILVRQFGWAPPEPGRKVEGKQITATIGASNSTVSPGQRITLTADVDLQPDLHVYAPGVDNYIPIEWKMDDPSSVQAHDTVFPRAEKLFLKAINETVPTYTNHFRLTRDITIPPGDKLKQALDASGRLAVNSTLNYQACDDRMCYFPQKVRLQWTFEYQPLDKERVSASAAP